MQKLSGLDLSEAFFREIVQPILQKRYPGLPITAGLLGPGSEVLGFDDSVSTDHDWGPRLMLFLREEDMAAKQPLMEAFAKEAPQSFCGFPVFFVRTGSASSLDARYPNIDIHTIKGYGQDYLGVDVDAPLDAPRWLAIPEHRLLGYTSGRLFQDDLRMQDVRDRFAYYPEDVRRYLLASYWQIISEEQAFMKRCASRGDELGSRQVCARVTERLMRLCFLYKRRYAPYSKWFGTAFQRLGLREIQQEMEAALAAQDIAQREAHYVRMQWLTAQLHDQSGITEPLHLQPISYFEREIQVLFVERIGEAIQKTIQDARLREALAIGSLMSIGGLVAMENQDPLRIAALYAPII